MLTFHSSTGGFMYNIIDITGSIFSCGLVFYEEMVSVVLYMDNLITSSPFLVPFARLLVFLKNTLSPTLKLGGVQFVVFCVCLNLFSSKVFLAMASARQCDLRSKCPESGSPRNHCIGSSNWWRGKYGSLP